MSSEFQVIKLFAEVIALMTLTLVLILLYSLHDVMVDYFDKRTLTGIFTGIFIFWLGYFENVLNDIYNTPLTKILDDVLIASGMVVILTTTFLMKKQIRAVKPKVVINGKSLLSPDAYITESLIRSILPLLRGRRILAITRHPQVYKEHGVPYIWISNVPAENAVRPTELAPILHKVLSSVDENTFVIVDGLEYLILNNGFEPVMKFLLALKDNLLTKNAGIVVTIDPKTIDKKQLNILKREFKTLPLQKP